MVLGAPELFATAPQPEWVADLLADPSSILYWASDDNGGALGYLLAALLPMPDSAEVFVYSMGLAHSDGHTCDSAVSAALLDRVAAFAEDSACSRLWGVPFPGNRLYDDGGTETSGLDLPLA